MAICTSCYNDVPEGSAVCPVCGAVLDSGEQYNVTPKRNVGGIILKVIAIVLALALLAGGIAAVVLTSRPEVRLARAGIRTCNALQAQLKNEAGVAVPDSLQKALEKGKFSADVTIDSDYFTVSTALQVSRPAKRVSGEGVFSLPNYQDLGLRYYLDRKQFEIAAPNGLNVYGATYKDISNKLSKLGIGDVESFINNLLFSNSGTQTGSSNSGSGMLQQIADTVNVERMDKTTIRVGGEDRKVNHYKLTWKPLSNVSTDSGLLQSILGVLEPEIDCYVDKSNRLVAADFMTPTMRYTLTLDGDKNLWEKMTLRGTSLKGESFVFYGGLSCNGDQVKLAIRKDAGELVAIDYDKQSGHFVLTAEGAVLFEGTVILHKDQVGFAFELQNTEIGRCALSVSVRTLSGTPDKLAKKYIDLTDLSLSDIQRLCYDFGVNWDTLSQLF